MLVESYASVGSVSMKLLPPWGVTSYCITCIERVSPHASHVFGGVVHLPRASTGGILRVGLIFFSFEF